MIRPTVAWLTAATSALVVGCAAPQTTSSTPEEQSPEQLTAPAACAERVYEGGYAVGEQTPVEALAGYTAVTGTLTIHETALEDLEPLSCLRSVGALHIDDNPALRSLEGLHNLETVREFLSLEESPALEDLRGLRSLTEVGTGMGIRSCDALTTLVGLESLTSVGGGFGIDYNDSLVSLEGLGSLTSIGANFGVEDNAELRTLRGIEGLTSVRGHSWITSNPRLPTCEARALERRLYGDSPPEWDRIEGNDDQGACQ